MNSFQPRQTAGAGAGTDAGLDGVLQKIHDSSQYHGDFSKNAILSSLAYSVVFSAALFLAFCILRPRHNAIYAPKAKFVSTDKSPPTVGKGFFAWLRPIYRTDEVDVMDKIGLDAVAFLRFNRMMRVIFFVATLLGCALILPLNIVSTQKSGDKSNPRKNPLGMLTIQSVQGSWLWAHVIMAWCLSLFVMYMLYRNYRKMIALRKIYFASPEYQQSLHGRSIMVTDVSGPNRDPTRFEQFVRGFGHSEHLTRVALGRDIGELADQVEEHKVAVREFEHVLAKYLKNPNRLPSVRPQCTAKKGPLAGQKVDSIKYYSELIQALEMKIDHARANIDSFGPQRYGFASYDSIVSSHNVVRENTSKSVDGTSVSLAPRPIDLLWINLQVPKIARQRNRTIGNVLLVLFSCLWIVPSALIATFLANISNIGYLSPSFQKELLQHPTLWAVIQGIAAPIVLNIFFFFLPIILRRLSAWQGDFTKTSREKAVLHKLYFFFIFNNLILFTLIQTIWNIVTEAIYAQRNGGGSSWWDAVQQFGYASSIASGIISTSAFWIMYLAQRYISCFMNIAQVDGIFFRLYNRLFSSVTPRDVIEWSAPPPFIFSVQYNNVLFYSTIAFAYSVIAPLILPFALIYFLASGMTTKYCLFYINLTRVESGGSFWKVAFNRVCFAMGFSHLIHFIVIFMRSFDVRWRSYCVLPIILVWVLFKIFVWRVLQPEFDYCVSRTGEFTKDSEYSISPSPSVSKLGSSDKISSRYGHPALHEPLFVPMVEAHSQHLLPQLYSGRLADDDKSRGSPETMDNKFEVVNEGRFDPHEYQNRPEFAENFGAGDPAMDTASYNETRQTENQADSITDKTFFESDHAPSSHGRNYAKLPVDDWQPPSHDRSMLSAPVIPRRPVLESRTSESSLASGYGSYLAPHGVGHSGLSRQVTPDEGDTQFLLRNNSDTFAPFEVPLDVSPSNNSYRGVRDRDGQLYNTYYDGNYRLEGDLGGRDGRHQTTYR